MHFEGTVQINAPRDKVWAFLIDPSQVGSCGPGVESIEVIDDTHFKAAAKVGVGFISARFNVNMELVGDGVLDPRRPEIVIYEPLPNGGRRLIGADFLVFVDAWHANNAGTPELGGQLLHLFESPNRFGLPAFYTLHVWAWKPNPTGAFVNWHSNVSCEQFDGEED